MIAGGRYLFAASKTFPELGPVRYVTATQFPLRYSSRQPRILCLTVPIWDGADRGGKRIRGKSDRLC